MLFLCGPSKRGNPFCGVSTKFLLQGYFSRTLEFHSRLTILSLGLTSHIPGLVSNPAPTAGQSRELLINLNNKNAPGSSATYFNRHLSTSESDPTEPWVVFIQCWWVVLREWNPNKAESPQFMYALLLSLYFSVYLKDPSTLPMCQRLLRLAWLLVPGELCPCPSPAVLPASQIHGNVGVHRVTPQHCKSSSFGITPGTDLWYPSPSHLRASMLWEQAYINVHLFQLSFCCFLFASQLFYSPFHVWFLSFSVPFLPTAWQGGAMQTSSPEPQQKHLEFFTPFTVLWAHQQCFFNSKNCTFSSRNFSWDVYVVQPNEFPDKPFFFLNLTLDYPLLFHKFPISLQLWKYRFNWFHSSGNHQPTPFLIMTFSYEHRSPEHDFCDDSESQKTLNFETKG